MSQTIHRQLITALALLAVGIAAPAFAHGRGDGPAPGRPGGPHALHSRGILSQLIFPCEAACADDAETCVDTANDAARACVSGSCATEVTAAQTACGADRKSTDCRAAVSALSECADTCLATSSTATSACHTTLTECRAACAAE